MMTTQIRKYVAVALIAAGACAAYAFDFGKLQDELQEMQEQSKLRNMANMNDVWANSYADNSSERHEQESAPDRIKEIFALAKKSAKEDGSINFCGFFVGMSHHDAQALANYYKKMNGINGTLDIKYRYDTGKAVWIFYFTLKAVRRITNGGNSFRELVQAVANRVGGLKANYETGEYEYKTIDGCVLTMDEKDGLRIWNKDVRQQKPIRVTAVAAQKDKADVDAAQKAAAEEAVRNERATKKAIASIVEDMVTIPGKNFKMGKYEVTRTQWIAVINGIFIEDNNPKYGVSEGHCQEFLEKLNSMPEIKASGLVFRLPTEVEWEYACRAGGTGDYCRLTDGTEITKDTLGKVAWYDGKVHPVGQKEPNAFGLYDMLGNMSERCENLKEAGRGGDYDDTAADISASKRDSFLIDTNVHLGFRLVAQTKEEAARVKAEKEAAIREAQEAAIREKKEVIQGIIQDMVAIPGKDFMIGKYEVTQKQWGALMDSKPSMRFKGDNHPVTGFQWNHGSSGSAEYFGEVFLERLNATPEVKAAGLTFRLPTVEEWEYACRGGKEERRNFWSGKVDYGRLVDGTELTEKTLGKVAWYGKNSGMTTHPVGQKMPNAFGLYDMFGNVGELCVEKESKHKHRHREAKVQFDRLMLKGGNYRMPDYEWAAGRTTYYFSGMGDAAGMRLVADKK